MSTYIPSSAKPGVAVLVWCKDHILIGKRKGSHGAGTWSLPGGKMEGDLSPELTALEELKQEIGLKKEPEDLKQLGWSHSMWTDPEKGFQHWITLFFSVEVDHQTDIHLMEPDKCEEWMFVNPLALRGNFTGEIFEPFRQFLLRFPPEEWELLGTLFR